MKTSKAKKTKPVTDAQLLILERLNQKPWQNHSLRYVLHSFRNCYWQGTMESVDIEAVDDLLSRGLVADYALNGKDKRMKLTLTDKAKELLSG